MIFAYALIPIAIVTLAAALKSFGINREYQPMLPVELVHAARKIAGMPPAVESE
jgi:hypothetical protein